MAKNRPTKIESKKHLARQERERRQTRLISGVAIGMVAFVILIIAYGLLNDTLFLKFRPAVTVNGESLTLEEFQIRVRVARQQLIDQYVRYYQIAQMFGIDTSSDTQLSQIVQQLDTPSALGAQILDVMASDLIARQYAQANGIVVTEADIENAIQDGLGYYPSGTPTQTQTPTTLVYSTLNPTQLALAPPTATFTPLPTNTPDLVSTATTVPSATPISTATAVPSITPTATPFTQQAYEQRYQDALQYYKKLGLSEERFRKVFYEFGLYQDRVKALVTADVKHEEEQVWLRHILVADGDTALEVRNKLMGGASFADLAAEYSIDTSSQDNGGDLGWLSRSDILYGTDVEEAAFSLGIGEISEPIQSIYGYQILQVLGHEVRPLTETQYEDAVTAAYNDWLDAQRSEATIKTNSNWLNYVPSSPTLEDAFAQEYATQTAYVQTYLAGVATTSPAESTPTPTP